VYKLASRCGCYDIRNASYFDPLPNSRELMQMPSTTPYICDFGHLKAGGIDPM